MAEPFRAIVGQACLQVGRMKKRYLVLLKLALLALAVLLFAWYLRGHPALLVQLRKIPRLTALWVLFLYVAWFAALAFTVHATLRLCGRRIDGGENILLNAYSTLVNFFVPGQGGVAVRGLYMKRRHALPLRHYVLGTLMYYACYAVISAVLLFAPSRPLWQTLLGLLAVGLGSVFVVRWYAGRSAAGGEGRFGIRFVDLVRLLFATLVQAAVQVAVYAAELHAVDPHIGLSQIVTYTGAANFSLFVALTPGGIGVREAFLLFSRRLHHIGTQTILAASVIDRAVFLVLLAILFLVTLAFHARKALHIEQAGDDAGTPVQSD